MKVNWSLLTSLGFIRLELSASDFDLWFCWLWAFVDLVMKSFLVLRQPESSLSPTSSICYKSDLTPNFLLSTLLVVAGNFYFSSLTSVEGGGFNTRISIQDVAIPCTYLMYSPLLSSLSLFCLLQALIIAFLASLIHRLGSMKLKPSVIGLKM